MLRPVKHQIGKSFLDDWSSRAFDLSLHSLQDVVLPGANVHYALCEVPMTQVLDLLPASLHPCIPGVVAMTFIQCDEGPWGPFEMALMGIGCRSGIRPRFLILGAFANSKESVRNLRERCGYPVRLAEVNTKIYYDQIRSTIVENGCTILDIQTTAVKTLIGSGGSVVYSPTLTMNDVSGDKRLVQLDWSADFHRVGRGELRVDQFDDQALVGGRLEPADSICATLARADMVLHRPVFTLDPFALPTKESVVRLKVAA